MSAWAFRSLARADFPLLALWLQAPHVARWWADDASPQGLESDYGPVIDGTEPCEVFIALRNGAPFGLVQRLAIAAYPEYEQEYAALCPVPPGAWSIDYLVGAAGDTGRGWGSAMLAAFVRQLWADQPQASCLLVAVHVSNEASWRALARCRFRRVAHGEMTPDNPADTREHVVYRIDRPV